MGYKQAVKLFCFGISLVLLAACGGVQEKTEIPLQETISCNVVVLEADGRRITIEDAAGCTLSQLLQEAQIRINEGDMVTLDPAETVVGQIQVSVLRRCTVQFVVEGSGEKYTAVLYGGTVEDAVNAAGIRMNRAQTMDAEPDEAIRDGMVIHIVSNGEAPADSTPPPTPTPAPTSAPASTGEITVVSMEKYEDCDGSGHGVIVYTYSDGSQEEVEY